jgi:chemotaxis protein CheC
MSVNPLNRLADFQLDVLREIGNIGAGHAASALSLLLGKPVNLGVPKVRLIPFEETCDSVGGPEQVVAAVFLRVSGEVSGNLFFLLRVEAARVMLRKLPGMAAGPCESFSGLESSALGEIGNILAGSYLSAFADLTGLNMQPSTPALLLDMAGAILGSSLAQYGEIGERALLIDTRFLRGEEEWEGHFILIPDPDAFDPIFRSLGVPLP